MASRAFTILIVEDVAQTRDWLAELIQTHFEVRPGGEEIKVQVRKASGGVEARHEISRHRPDFILLDEVLGPGEDLASLLSGLLSEGLRVLLMTGGGEVKNLPPGVQGRIFKPRPTDRQGIRAFLEAIGQASALTAPRPQG